MRCLLKDESNTHHGDTILNGDLFMRKQNAIKETKSLLFLLFLNSNQILACVKYKLNTIDSRKNITDKCSRDTLH